MNNSKIIKVHNDMEKILQRQMVKLFQDCEELGIPKRNISKVKASKLLAKRIQENEKKILGIL